MSEKGFPARELEFLCIHSGIHYEYCWSQCSGWEHTPIKGRSTIFSSQRYDYISNATSFSILELYSKRPLLIVKLWLLLEIPFTICDPILPRVPYLFVVGIAMNIDRYFLSCFDHLLFFEGEKYRKPAVKVLILVFGNNRKICLSVEMAIEWSFKSMQEAILWCLPANYCLSLEIILSQWMNEFPNLLRFERTVIFWKINCKVFLSLLSR